MKKVLLIFLGLFIFGCISNFAFTNNLLTHNKKINFSLTFSDFVNRPVVSFEDSGILFHFLVDTGNTLSYINENGCQKLNIDLSKESDLYGAYIDFFIEDKRYLVDGKNHTLSMKIRQNETFEEKEIDGMIGIDFLSQYENVVFDYKRKTLYFNQPPITSYPIEMYKTSANVYYIYYKLNEKIDFGLLDTGSDCFVVREDYQNDYVNLDEKVINEFILNSPYIKEKRQRQYFSTITIGNVKYKNVSGLFAIDERIQMNKEATKEHRLRSVLGFSFFNKHKIQLDFKNNLFYIK